MDHSFIISELQSNGNCFQGLLEHVPIGEYTWKQKPDKWCMLEIICHLYDEEREDFRMRTKHILETNNGPFPPINPTGWVISRKYMQQDFKQKLNGFLDERKKSIRWLKSLENPDWKKYYDHPKFGKMSAWLFLSNWLAHDYLHIKQITRLKYDYLMEMSKQTLRYAGKWT